MMRGIRKEEHGIADYIYVPLVLAAPKLLRFTDDQPAAGLCYAMGAGALGYSLCTNAPWGVIKLIPYKTHVVIDLCAGVLALAAPMILPVKKQNARTALLLMGITGLVVGALSLVGAARASSS
jgi:hypothetical protein